MAPKKIELPYNPVILFLDIFPNEIKSANHRDICLTVFIMCKILFVIDNKMETG